MTEEAAFITAILEDPRDLALRQVYAHWLEVRGDPGRAASGSILAR